MYVNVKAGVLNDEYLVELKANVLDILVIVFIRVDNAVLDLHVELIDAHVEGLGYLLSEVAQSLHVADAHLLL